MTAKSFYRGHPIYYYEDGVGWRFEDDGEPVTDVRPCGSCHRRRTERGHDPCIADLPGVSNACCGHGHGGAYVQLDDGTHIGGQDAVALQCALLMLGGGDVQ